MFIITDNTGEFLNWWFDKDRLTGRSLSVFNRYYSNYRNNFNKYLMKSWSDRHLELDNCIKSLLRKEAVVNIMDLGCGTGSISLYIASKCNKKIRVLGIDINKNRLFCAKERQRILEHKLDRKLNCGFIHSNILSLSDSKKYNLIYLEETFHHLEPRRKVVERIANLLADNGILIISEVNPFNPLMEFQLFAKRGFKTIQNMIDENGTSYLYGVERLISPNILACYFESNGLKKRTLRYFRIFPTKIAILSTNRLNLSRIENFLLKAPLLKFILSIHYNIVMQKTSNH